MEKRFKDKVVIVTGGSYGIGRASAVAFAAEGANVVVADYVEDKHGETLSMIRAAGSEGIFIKCDVSKDDDVKAMIAKTIKTFGRIDFAFNNAGIEGLIASTKDCSEENWDRTIAVNLKGVWLCMKYEIPEMLKQGKGAIVNCASVAALIGFPALPAYVASKHGVAGITKTAALENARQNIRINAVCPGVIQTPMIDRVTGKDKEIKKKYIDMEPVGRLGRAEEVANTVIWLCSDDASFVTGICMPVDGGWIAGS